MNFKEFMEQEGVRIHNQFSQNTVGTHNDRATGAMLPSTWTGSEDLGPYSYGLPGTDLEIPQTTRRSKIRSVEKNRDPIRVRLMDGTVVYLTVDEFKRAESKTRMAPGSEVTVTFQRRPEDSTDQPSKIVDIG